MSNGFESDVNPIDTSNPYADNPYAAPSGVGDVSTETNELATRSARFTGAFVDGLLMLPAAALIFFLAVQIGLGLQGEVITAQIAAGVMRMLVVSAWYLILNGYTLANRGQTLGKMAAGTKIVDARTGEILPLMQLFLKRFFSVQVITLIPLVGNIFGLVNVLMIFRENRRCWHDDFAGTKVINVRK